jgi:AcrR family transcriptional regulator
MSPAALARKPRVQKPKRTPRSARDVILKAATEVFIEHGFTGSSIDQIAARAGVSKPTIYSHFDGKEKLFVAIMNAICDDFAVPILEPGADTEDLSVILVRIANNYTRSILQPHVVALHRLFVAEAERFPDLSRRYYQVGPESVHKILANFLKVRMARGEIRKADPLMLAQFFAALIITPMRTKRLFAVEGEVDWTFMDQYCRKAVELFLNGCTDRAS